MIFTEATSLIQGLPLNNLDLLSVGVTIAAIMILGFVVYINDRKSITNKSFLFFAIVTVFWSTLNYLSYQTQVPDLVLWLFRLVVFFGVWHSFSFFQFLYVFPEKKKIFPAWYRFILLPYVVLVSIFTLTPLVFSGITQLSNSGSVSTADAQKGIIVFVLTVVGLILAGVIVFIKKIHRSAEDRKQYWLVLIGAIITFALLFTFNLVLPAIFSYVRFIPLGALFIFPFIAFTFYAIYKRHLFEIRAVIVVVLTFVLTVGTGLEIIFSNTLPLIIFRCAIFIFVLAMSIMMNRFVETIAEQRENLTIANAGQTNLIHIINHQIKGYLAKGRNVFAELLEEPSYGLTAAAKPMVEGGFDALTEGVDFVQQVLTSSSAEKGTLQYNMAPFDFKALVLETSAKQKDRADEKKLALNVATDNADYVIVGDASQLKEAVRNLIDNSIIYTPSGSVTVSLSRSQDKVLFSVKDTGLGITDADKARLFTQGGKGKDSIKVNANSTGYGLAFVKGVIVAHKGRVWAESQGPGKGSQFYMELPAGK